MGFINSAQLLTRKWILDETLPLLMKTKSAPMHVGSVEEQHALENVVGSATPLILGKYI